MGDSRTASALADVAAERQRQTSLGHVHDHDDGLDILHVVPLPSAASVRALCESGETWSLVLLEEALEALEARTAEELRAELVQVAAVAVRWIEAIDAR